LGKACCRRRLFKAKTHSPEGLSNSPLAANSPGLQREMAAHGLGIVALDDRLAAPGSNAACSAASCQNGQCPPSPSGASPPAAA